MEHPDHAFSELFEQLGLASDAAAIKRFIDNNAPLPDDMELADAPCWNEGQADFLREAKEDDADWAELVDQLDASLRKP
ncbi:DUF2789 domain-containing protein [Halomonas binhaiensis]|uniref:DUF2789 domain-containing protein n=1 Tax=Halomonas binhaiensis TaxID=2562282 RepID=A0A5C1NIA4_9GAMM|nr:DUF2789 domain-containing protein [Halomonas binhaiensis]QEM81977.1 DUF2789 domain-containing protein [Halomonas binhaiensis]